MMQMLNNQAANDQAKPAKQPAHQSAYEDLRARILFGDIAPGQAVTIQGLTEELSAGMTPVREAIRRLTSEGALEMQGNRRVCVPDLSESGVQQLEFMRLSLEPKLAEEAANRLNADELAQIRAEDDALNDAIAQGDIARYLEHNYRFHAMLNVAAQAPILAETVDRLWLRFGPSLRVVCGRYGTLNLPDKHADILSALENRDPDAAAQAMAEDVSQGMVQIRAALKDVGANDRFD